MNSKRQLAAILFADIQGYTAMMQRDEQRASAHLRHFQKQMAQGIRTSHCCALFPAFPNSGLHLQIGSNGAFTVDR